MQRRKTYLIVLISTALGCATAGKVETSAPRSDVFEGSLEEVARSQQQWTGIAVAPDGRVIVNYPRWSDSVPISVAVLSSGGAAEPYPDQAWNRWSPGDAVEDAWVCVQSVVVDDEAMLWVLDPGNPRFEGVIPGAPKLVKIDLDGDVVERVYRFAPPAITESSYLNDVRVDVGTRTAYLTDSGDGALLVLDLETGVVRRLLDEHPATHAEDVVLEIGGRPWLRGDEPPRVHADGIALDVEGGWLYFQALTGRTLYRAPLTALRDAELPEGRLAHQVEPVAESGGADGLLFHGGDVYISALERDAVLRVDADGREHTVLSDPALAWPDSFAVGADGMIYVTTSRIHEGGRPAEPYRIFRFAP